MRKLNEFDMDMFVGSDIYLTGPVLEDVSFSTAEVAQDVVSEAILSLNTLVETAYHSPSFFGETVQTTLIPGDVEVGGDVAGKETFSCCSCMLCSEDANSDSLIAAFQNKIAGITEASGAGLSELIAQTQNAGGWYDFTGDQNVDATLIGSRWTETTLTFSFPTDGSFYGPNYEYGPSGADGREAQHVTFNAAQQDAVRYGLSLISEFTSLNFVEITETATVHARLRFSQTDNTTAVGSAQGLFPSSADAAGDVWFGRTNQPFYLTPDIGNWGMSTILHEIGHAVGLKHGHQDYTTLDLTGFVDAPSGGGARFGSRAIEGALDGQSRSLMTYTLSPGVSGFGGEGFNQPQTYMMFDIAALQVLYGADFTSNGGNTIYTFSTTTGEMFVDGVSQGVPASNLILRTIWDGNGTDTYDLSNYTTDLDINLAPGEFSTFDPAQLADHNARNGGGSPAEGNVGNALQFEGDARSLIENAIGGSGDDFMQGNAADNTLDGGIGSDTVSYALDTAGVTVNLQTGTGSGADVGSDTLISIENAIGGSGNDTLQGSTVDNLLNGGDGDDQINGAQGNDTLFGGFGADVLIGSAGNDTIYGGNNDSGGASSISFGSGMVTRAAGAGNNSFGTAIDVTTLFSLAADADIANATTVPHVSVDATGDAAPSIHFYEVNLTNIGTVLTVDVDYANGSGVNFDSLIVIYDSTMTQVASGDDSSTSDGAGGSTSTLDSFLSYTTASSGVFYIAVGQYSAAGQTLITAGGTYELQISVEEAVVVGDASNDTLRGGAGDDELYGENGDDIVQGQSGNDEAYGGNGDDTIDGNSGDDILDGGAGVDTINGGGGNDDIEGGDGNDILSGAAGEDTINGGTGNDTIFGNNQADTLFGNGGVDAINGGAGNDTIDGGGGSDSLIGSAGQDTIYGQAGNDYLQGDSGGDDLFGGAGNDTIVGGGGNDEMTGGAGADTFIQNQGFGIDRVYDFEDGIDLIDFSANGLANDIAGVLAAASQVGANVRIDLNANNSIILQNFDLADLDASDFIF